VESGTKLTSEKFIDPCPEEDEKSGDEEKEG
jgi:hypothetical protein